MSVFNKVRPTMPSLSLLGASNGSAIPSSTEPSHEPILLLVQPFLQNGTLLLSEASPNLRRAALVIYVNADIEMAFHALAEVQTSWAENVGSSLRLLQPNMTSWIASMLYIRFVSEADGTSSTVKVAKKALRDRICKCICIEYGFHDKVAFGDAIERNFGTFISVDTDIRSQMLTAHHRFLSGRYRYQFTTSIKRIRPRRNRDGERDNNIQSNMRADAPSFKPMEPATVDAGHLTPLPGEYEASIASGMSEGTISSAGCAKMHAGAISYVHAMSRSSSDHSGLFQ